MVERASIPRFDSVAELEGHLLTHEDTAPAPENLPDKSVESVSPPQTEEEKKEVEGRARDEALRAQLIDEGFLPSVLDDLEQAATNLYMEGNELASKYILNQIAATTDAYGKEFQARKGADYSRVSPADSDALRNANESKRRQLEALLENSKLTLEQTKQQRIVEADAERDASMQRAKEDVEGAYSSKIGPEEAADASSTVVEAQPSKPVVPAAKDKKLGFFEKRRLERSRRFGAEASRSLNEALASLENINRLSMTLNETKAIDNKKRDINNTLNAIFEGETVSSRATVKAARRTAEIIEFRELKSRPPEDLTKDQRNRLKKLGKSYR